MLQVLAILTGFLVTAHSVAEAPVAPISQNGHYIGSYLKYFVTTDHDATIEQIRKLPEVEWHHSARDIPSFGYTDKTYWFRFAIANPDETNLDLVLELGYGLLDEVDLYLFHDDEVIQRIATGDHKPFEERKVLHRAFIFPVQVDPGEVHEIYLRVKTSSSLQLPLQLWTGTKFQEHDQLALFGHGIYYGIVLVMAFYNLFLFLRVRDPAYLYYVLYVCTFALIQLSISGFAYQYVWPNAARWNEHSIAVLVPTVVIWAALFLRRSLLLPGTHPKFERCWNWLGGICGCLAILALFLPYQLAIRAGIVSGILACCLALYMSYYVWLKDHHKYAAYTSIAWTVFLVGVVFLSLNKFGFIPRIFLTESAAQIGSAIEVILLSYGLAERLNDANRQQYKAQFAAREANDRLLKLEREQRVQLEEEVRQRTRELQEAVARVGKLNEELQQISVTDQLTGARNRRFFDDYMGKELRRARRSEIGLSLLMLDIDFFKHVNDTYGHHPGDVCLQAVVKTISMQLRRPQDEVCRYGGEEIAIVLPETNAEGAAHVAEAIRKAIECMELKTGQGIIQVTASIGISSAESGVDKPPARFIEEADQALYVSKHQGRNRVTIFSDEMEKLGPP